MVFIFFLFADQVSAFSISPTRFLITANPDTKQIVWLNVKNDEQESKKFKIFVGGLKQEKNGALVFQRDLDVAETWAQTDQQTITLSPNAQAKIKFVIAVPKTAPPGSHYLGLAAETVSDDTVGSAVGGRLFAILTLRVAGEAVESVSVDKWVGPTITWKRDWPLILQLNNNGNIDVPIKSEINIKYHNKIINTIDWPLGNNLLTKSARYLEKTVSPSMFWPGRYEAQNRISYGRSGQAVWGLHVIWYFPIWSIIDTAMVLVVFILVYIKIRYRHVEV